MLRLIELEPQWKRLEQVAGQIYLRGVPTIAEAQGIIFLCPVCWTNNKGPIGTHSIMCWSKARGIPDEIWPNHGRWGLNGTSFDDLTLSGEKDPNLPSVLLNTPGGCAAHFLIVNGEIR